jgi:hypothetical protein
MPRSILKWLCILAITPTLLLSADWMKLLPQPDSSRGWRFDIQPDIYTRDNLFEYINGEAELFNDYGFVEMVTAAYIRGDDFSHSFSIDLYDMGSPLNSFGIYSSYRNPGLTFVEMGYEATISDLNIRCFKGNYFIQLNAGSLSPELHATMEKTASDLVDRIPATAHPIELTLLPADGQIRGSLKYITNGFMGQSIFPAGLQAQYVVQGDTLQAFLVLTQTALQAEKAFLGFKNHLKSRGNILSDEINAIEVEMPYQGRILALRHLPWVLGCSEYTDRSAADQLVERILSSLNE